MALIDVLIPEADPQQGILEIGDGVLYSPDDILADQGIEELILIPGGGNTYPRSRVVNT